MYFSRIWDFVILYKSFFFRMVKNNTSNFFTYEQLLLLSNEIPFFFMWYLNCEKLWINILIFRITWLIYGNILIHEEKNFNLCNSYYRYIM